MLYVKIGDSVRVCINSSQRRKICYVCWTKSCVGCRYCSLSMFILWMTGVYTCLSPGFHSSTVKPFYFGFPRKINVTQSFFGLSALIVLMFIMFFQDSHDKMWYLPFQESIPLYRFAVPPSALALASERLIHIFSKGHIICLHYTIIILFIFNIYLNSVHIYSTYSGYILWSVHIISYHIISYHIISYI